MRLTDLKNNDVAIIKKIDLSDNEIRRLYDLGFVVGSKVIQVLVSPSKNIKAYSVKGSIVALRNSNASKIEVEYAKEDSFNR